MTAAKWTPRTITIAGPDGAPADCAGWTAKKFPGLAVHHYGESGYGVTHIESGRGIARFFVTRAAAVALIQEIAPLADWMQDAPPLQADDELSRSIWRIRAAVYAREEQGEFGPVDHDLIAEFNRFESRLEECQRTKELGQKVRARGARNVNRSEI